MNHNEGTKLSRADQKELAAAAENSNPHNEAAKPGDASAPRVNAPAAPSSGPAFRIPPLTAIGGVILHEWAHGRAGRQSVAAAPPANL